MNKLSDDHKKNISRGVQRAWLENPEKFSTGKNHSISVGKGTKGKYKGSNIDSLYDLSARTVVKLLKRMDLGCSNCGWNKSSCDLHHLSGRQIDDPHNHNNLTLLCPNCHRMVHNHLIDKLLLIKLSDYLPNNWKDFYYG